MPAIRRVPIILLAGLCGTAACGRPSTPAPDAGSLPAPSAEGLFTDVTEAAGITARHRLPGDKITNIIDASGAGAAFADLDGDGWLDLVVLGGPLSPEPAVAPEAGSEGGRQVYLYRNLGDGRFSDITSDSGIPLDASAAAVAVADVDGDGDRDLFLAKRGPNRLYRNRGNAVFDDITRKAGVGDPGFGIGAVFFDMDADGDQDLYVTNYLEYDPRQIAYYGPEGCPGPSTYKPQPDVIYRNRGDGTFEDVSREAGVAPLMGRGMSLAAFDADEDGDTDVFVANDVTENFLLLNDGRGRFTEAGVRSGVATGDHDERTSAMAADVGDVDGDGQLDLVVSDTAYGAVYRRIRPGVFRDEAMRSGVALLCGQYVSWGQNLLDFDNDGDLDMLTVNGGLHHLVGWEDILMRNDGKGRFTDASREGGPYFATKRVGRASVTGDYDNDGDIDIFVTTLQGRHHLLRNDLPAKNSWITLDLVGAGARDPHGAKVELTAGNRTYVAELRCRSTYLGQGDPRLHFGLGRGVDKVDRIRIRWHGGGSSTLTDVPARQVLRIAEREAAS